MDAEKKARLEARGYRVGTAAEFLGLTDEDNRVIELRLAVSRAVSRRRTAGGLTQAQLAEKIGSSQSRIAKIEAGVMRGVTLDLAFKALFALGGGLKDLTPTPAAKPLSTAIPVKIGPSATSKVVGTPAHAKKVAKAIG